MDGLFHAVQAFLADDPYIAVEQVNDNDVGPGGFASVSHTFVGQIRKQPPFTWSPIIGDCLNNLRSSLDHLAWALAGARGKKTAFPIFGDPRSYKGVALKSHLRYVRKDAHALIESLQPYNHVDGPKNHLLFILDRLTNEDKHRELIAPQVGIIQTHFSNPVGQPADRDQLVFEISSSERWFEDGTTIVRYHTSNPNVYVPIEFTFDVAFDPEGPASGRPLLQCLGALGVAVSLVLREFERQFFPDVALTPPLLEGRAVLMSDD